MTCSTDAGDVALKVPLKKDFWVAQVLVRVRKKDDLGFRIADVLS